MRGNWDTFKSVSVGSIADEVRRKIASDMDDEAVDLLCRKAVEEYPPAMDFSAQDRARLQRLVFCTLRCELEILQDLADDPEVTEIMVNGCGNIFLERAGRMQRADISFESPERLTRVIQRIAAAVGREMNDLNPIVDARLSDGSRVNAVNANIAINGPILTIRKFNRSRISMNDLMRQGDISPEAAGFLGKLVRSGYNIFVSGGTSSGKTTFLNVLSDMIPPQERIIVIEDSAELQIRGHDNIVRMEAKNANAQGRGGVSIRDLIRTSLRMRPDRIIVGEVRGGEVVDMLAAMSTGHDGSLSTGHANSPRGMLLRLETLFLAASGFPLEAVRGQIAGAIDLFVHLARTADGHRRVMEISEVLGYENGVIGLNTLFEYCPGEGLKASGNKLVNTAKLRLAGEL